MSGRNDGSTRWRPMPSMRDGRPVNADGSPRPARVEDRVLRVDDAHPRGVPAEAGVAADRRARPAGSGPHHDPRGNGVSLQRHLAEDRLRDVVVAAPVGRALRVGELVEEVPAALGREPLRLVVHGRRVVDQVTRPSLRLDQRDLLGAGGGRHDGDERQAEEPREVRLGDGRRAAGGLDDRRPLRDPAVAQAVEEQRACESMLQRSRRVDRLVLQVEVDAPLLGQRKGVQMRVGRAIGVGFDATDRLVRPRSRTEALTTVRGRRHAGSLSDRGFRALTPGGALGSAYTRRTTTSVAMRRRYILHIGARIPWAVGGDAWRRRRAGCATPRPRRRGRRPAAPRPDQVGRRTVIRPASAARARRRPRSTRSCASRRSWWRATIASSSLQVRAAATRSRVRA